ncbi:MAG: ABC transporter permease [Gammaproteobacteria bacterium]|nr:ABC transporter permease [Gammaproteobacteria bacterium]MDH5303134.1 ABC transporter permease [Gammaproteobacteria bacterium]MDH5320858.1 ABC transporter permease [Gammaproteobacteria bacterium]
MQRIDTFLMSLQAIRNNKLRSSLTLVGIILGVASIIAVMTGISVIQGTMEQEMSVLGTQTFQVQKWPAGFSTDEERRKAMRRPAVTLEDAQAIRDHVDTVDIVGAEIWDFGFKAEYRGEATNDNLAIVGGTPEYPQNNTHFVGEGRNISQMDVHAGRKVVVIGQAIAQKLYPFVDPVGREVRLDGRDYEIIGVFDEKKSAFGSQYDNYVLMPVSTFLNTYGKVDRDGFERSVNITVHAKTPEVVADAIAETRAVLRRVRGVPRGEEDNFDYFNSEGMIRQFNDMTAGIKVGAFVIGIIALLVAGIGIMNIMLVSVTERTKEIGIRKSLGAKPPYILRQFLLEAILLCNLGGIIGVALGFGIGNMMVKLGMSPTFEAVVPMQWAIIGLLFCTAVGVIFGMLPAIKASRLNPIDALRYE